MRLLQRMIVFSTLAIPACMPGCGGDSDNGQTTSLYKGGKPMGTLKMSTSAFAPGDAIPRKYTGEGDDVSPPFEFAGIPEGTKSLALICDDPDAPRQVWVHWVIYNIPAEASGLPEGVPRDAELAEPAGARQGSNSWGPGSIGYRGPMPPPGHGVHHYHFKLYALDRTLDLSAGTADKDTLLAAMQGIVLDEAEVVGTYERKK